MQMKRGVGREVKWLGTEKSTELCNIRESHQKWASIRLGKYRKLHIL